MASMQENINGKNIKDKIVAENNDEFIDGKAVPEYSAVGCTRLAYSQSLNSLLSLLLGNYESMTRPIMGTRIGKTKLTCKHVNATRTNSDQVKFSLP